MMDQGEEEARIVGGGGGYVDIASLVLDIPLKQLCGNIKEVVGYTYAQFRGWGWLGGLSQKHTDGNLCIGPG